METETQQEPLERFIRKKLVELKAVMGSMECRMNDFNAAMQTMESARNDALRSELTGTVNFLSKEMISICFKEFKHWIISGEVEKAVKAHMNAAIILSSSCKSIDEQDSAYFKGRVFSEGAVKLWDIGTYHHRQGNAYLLAGSPAYEVAKHWEIAVKCYANVQKLHEIGISIGAQVPVNYCEQAQAQISDIISAKSRLSQSA